jgi:glycosyltransferase involved in cell wall biosynthesis
MRLIVNLTSAYKGGAEQVAISFINECRMIYENEYHILLRENIAGQLKLNQFPDNFYFYKFTSRPASSLVVYFRTMREFNNLEKRIKPHCVISTGGHGYWRPDAPLVTGFNIPHYVYPESPYFQRIPMKKRLYWKAKKIIDLYFYGRVDALIVQTEDINQRLRAHLKATPVFTVSNAVNGYFLDPPSNKKKLPSYETGEVRLLLLASYYPHKNIEIIRTVIDGLVKRKILNIKFVLTLPEDIFNLLFDDSHKKFIFNVGPVQIMECPSLYEECDYMFLPTLLECFSASYVEAMLMAKPILTSDLGFAHTVCDDAAVYFNPVDPNDIIDKIVSLMNAPKLRDVLVENGKKRLSAFSSPNGRAEAFLSICKKMAKA